MSKNKSAIECYELQVTFGRKPAVLLQATKQREGAG